jgi:protein Mpv17
LRSSLSEISSGEVVATENDDNERQPHSSNATSFTDAIPREKEEEDDHPSSIVVEWSEPAPDVFVVIPPEMADGRHPATTTHAPRTTTGEDAEVDGSTHLLARGEFSGSHRPRFPSVPISYDERGIVQADSAGEALSLVSNVISAVDGVVVDAEDYPALVRILFKRDANGRTLATKLFNAALLAASFGYVLLSVFNIDGGMTRGWSPAEIGMRIPLDTWASYENSLSEKPVATKTIINIVIYLLGDWLSQTLFRGGDVLDFDASRTLRNGFVGMCFGPAVHEYYEFSDWILPVEGLTLGITNRAFKILMDQTIYLSVKCSIYIMAIAVLNGDSVEAGADNVKNRLKPIMFTAWKFWPLVHCVTYGLIPARHRILWVNSVDLVWNAILSSKARGDDDDDDDKGDDGSGGGSDGSDDDDGGEGRTSEAKNDGDQGGFDLFARLGSLLSSLDPSSRDEGGDLNGVPVADSLGDVPNPGNTNTLLG